MDNQSTVYEVNMTVAMKKAHPCGGALWKIVRMGADVKLQCQTCMKYINLSRDELKSRVKGIEGIKR